MAIKKDGTVIIDTLINTKGFNKGVGNMEKSVSGLSGIIGKLGKTVALVFGARALINFSKDAIKLGSDLQEVQNVVDVTFSTMSKQVDEFAQNAAQAFGLSETMAKRFAGTFGAMAKSFGFIEKDAFEMSTTLAGLAGDVASFYNITQEEAYTKLKSVFTGETESLKDLGVVMTQTALDSYAMANGFGMTTKAMNEQQKVALRYQFVLDQLSGASGDFIRTSDSWANQVRLLTLQFDSLKATIGQGLINAFTPVVKMLNTLLAKLQTVANAFRALTEQIFGKQVTQQASSNLGAIEDEYSGITDATNDAKKAQDKYLNGLDELNVIGGDSSDSLGFQEISLPSFEQTEEPEVLTKIKNSFDYLVDKAKELAEILKKGFFEGLGDFENRISTIKESLKSIKESVISIFDTRVIGSFEATFLSFIETLGVISGAIASIGLTLSTNIFGGWGGYLEESVGKIKRFIMDILNIISVAGEKVGNFISTLAYIFEPFADEDGIATTKNIISIFANTFMEITEIVAQFGLDLISLIVDPFVANKEEFRNAFSSVLSGLKDLTETIKTILEQWFGYLSQIYTKNISPIFEGLILGLESLYQNHIAPLITKLGDFFKVIADNLSVLWNELFIPVIEWFVTYVMPVVSSLAEEIGNVIIGMFATISDLISSFIDIIGGLIKIIVGTFTGDWKRAWEGIKEVFKGIWDSFVTIVKTPLNKVIELLNSFLGLVEQVQHAIADALTFNIDLPDWAEKLTGFSTFGVSIPKISIPRIPYLATGAVIPPNAPFMAMLGDQKHGTNLEAPESLIRQIVREEAGGGRELIPYLEELIRYSKETAEKDLTIGDRDIARANMRGQRSMGYSLITSG